MNYPSEKMNSKSFPIYGCLTSIKLSTPEVNIIEGINFRQTYVSTFGTTMMAFKPAPPNSSHPTPWTTVPFGFNFIANVEVEIYSTDFISKVSPKIGLWLVAALLRLQVPTPVRLHVLSHVPFHKIINNETEANIAIFETSLTHLALHEHPPITLSDEDLGWLHHMLPISSKLISDHRFFESFSIYEQAQWSSSFEGAMIMLWTSIEILFGLSKHSYKTKNIVERLSKYVGKDQKHCEEIASNIKSLYYKRGSTVHAGNNIDPIDLSKTIALVKVAFRRVLIDGKLPSVDKSEHFWQAN
jgi:hypothetical protein